MRVLRTLSDGIAHAIINVLLNLRNAAAILLTCWTQYDIIYKLNVRQ